MSETTTPPLSSAATTDTAARIAHLDCSSGVSGDKFLGALLDAGQTSGSFTLEQLKQLAAALTPGVTVEAPRTNSHGVAATGIRISERNEQPARSWADIRALIENAPAAVLPHTAAELALKAFGTLAQAEANVHGVAVDTVHFHEVGAADSILDICGVCLGLVSLDITTWYATPPALGSGTVKSSHGTLPVPAPATLEVLTNTGIPTGMSAATGELTTPTGAALLTLAAGFGPVPPLHPLAIGYGAGTRDIGQPNICRLLIGEPLQTSQDLAREMTVLLETNIDHITPEAVSFAGEELLAEGALDVWVTPIAMKKGRAALTLSVLSAPDTAEHFADRIVSLTGSLGVRVSEQPRLIARREELSITTPWGEVQVKHGGGRYRAEHDDITRIAHEQNLDYPEVLSTLNRCIHEQLEYEQEQEHKG